MFTIITAALAVLALDPAAAPAGRPSNPPGTAITAAPNVPQGAPMREVCRREREPGSNVTQRVCRQVPVNSSARDRSAGDRLREAQGARMPEGV